MIDMRKTIESYGSASLQLAYKAGGERVDIMTKDSPDRSMTLRFLAVEFDKIVEEYMYLRQFTNGRRAR